VTTDPQRRALVAALRDRHDGELQRVVARRATADRAIVIRASGEAWAQLVDAHDVDLHPPRWSALAWVTSYAMRRASALALEGNDCSCEARGAGHRALRLSGGPGVRPLSR
jgi:hypothetical protein